MLAEKLYCIETNMDFPRHSSALPNETLSTLLVAYGLPSPESVQLIVKHNKESTVYQVQAGAQNYIFRSCRTELASSIEQQCRIINAIEFRNTLQPLENIHGNFSKIVGGRSWLVYHYIEGTLFTGQKNELTKAIQKSLELTERLGKYATDHPSATDQLINISYRPEKWHMIPHLLCKPPGDILSQKVQASIGGDTLHEVQKDQNAWEHLISELGTINISPNSLVHYDLQHANIVITESGEPVIIDIEDLYLANRECALSYCIFKLIRHGLYMKTLEKKALRDHILPAVMERVILNSNLRDLHDVFIYASYRTVSDIYSLLYAVLEHGKEYFLYDLEKKIHNLYEIANILNIHDYLTVKDRL